MVTKLVAGLPQFMALLSKRDNLYMHYNWNEQEFPDFNQCLGTTRVVDPVGPCTLFKPEFSPGQPPNNSQRVWIYCFANDPTPTMHNMACLYGDGVGYVSDFDFSPWESYVDKAGARDAEILRLSVDVAAKDEEMRSLGRELADKDVQIGNLQGQVADKDEEIRVLNSQVVTKDAEIESLGHQLADREARILELRAQVAAWVSYDEEKRARLEAEMLTLHSTVASA
ncbi:unnamed protein product [Linum tenue]|uniref:Uncharacterized protein n=1 Tax=Linum tenue TaxID=586396 RepID=A0AAV0PZ71_9ROSI|nr:unnamed protein product [Linum tenue]